jgi:hypothetical protein
MNFSKMDCTGVRRPGGIVDSFGRVLALCRFKGRIRVAYQMLSPLTDHMANHGNRLVAEGELGGFLFLV